MDIDTSISDVLREVIKFLECLDDVKLSHAQEGLRQKLIMILKNKLTTMTRVSPEPYLNMVAGCKSLLQHTLPKGDSADYVEPSQKQIGERILIGADQNYYERVGNNSQIVATVADESSERSDQNENQRLIEIYKNLSATQAKGKCHKCGPLHRKEGKKLFLSENRACWVALVGSHLLIYRNEKTNRPYAIYPVGCYMARPAPNLIPRDRQKSESAFEIYSPGSETLQFIARTPKDMDQWVAKICEVGHDNEKGVAEVWRKKHAAVESQTNPDETVRDAKKSTDKPIKTDTTSDKERKDIDENPPPLPARIPRGLPSLPSGDAIVSHKSSKDDDDEDEDIYHKIEDLKNGTCYQNIALSKEEFDANDKKYKTMYDDTRLSKEKNEEQIFPEETIHDVTPLEEEEELYDDIGVISRMGNAVKTGALSAQPIQNSDRPVADGEEKQEFYDDVKNLIPNERFVKNRAKNQTETSKFLQKKSFLDRVLSRKESSGKLDLKRCKGKIPSPPSPSTAEKMSSCIDASDLGTPNQEALAEEREELSEYNCPPPPRPIYTKSLNNPSQVEEFYDDVNVCREQYSKSHQPAIPQSTLKLEAKETVNNTTCNVESKDESSQEEILHYQSPKSNLRIPDAAEIQPNEELYDDIALWTDFTARQRYSIRKKDGEDAKSIIAPDRKSWNRFVVNKKLRASDSNCSEVNRQNSECEELEDSSENNSVIKKNTFQKLISRVENSFAKVSARNSPSLPSNQSSTNNNS